MNKEGLQGEQDKEMLVGFSRLYRGLKRVLLGYTGIKWGLGVIGRGFY